MWAQGRQKITQWNSGKVFSGTCADQHSIMKENGSRKCIVSFFCLRNRAWRVSRLWADNVERGKRGAKETFHLLWIFWAWEACVDTNTDVFWKYNSNEWPFRLRWIGKASIHRGLGDVQRNGFYTLEQTFLSLEIHVTQHLTWCWKLKKLIISTASRPAYSVRPPMDPDGRKEVCPDLFLACFSWHQSASTVLASR